ncbi:GUN4 domain-containing protein [Oscillatoria sp. CS-180]|uniref:GUN4 domain-containing protein n=1 Tax=Oscillatoria sp. CS-180 TaxID=3021720 RepID=UPI00232E3F9B|nr:GUN4 domain-containing protein [Oscillatoria sp. CS-180]MDB9526133.1 GUN4 domain-containing protein [Oscillatoria sp. CS-180]
MAKNWAFVIGINEYNPVNFRQLKYARQDAEQITAFFRKADFEVCCFTDNSPPLTLPSGHPIFTQPTYGNLITFLQDRFETPFLNAGDNCWFFFAGHGERHQGQDYLMPMDANSRGVEVIAGLTISYVRERLNRCGADNVIMILDACRTEGARDSGGIGRESQKGVITLSSCQPTQKSWEIDALQQGAFTYALLEALQLSGERSCATVERLGSYLKQRVPDLCRQHGYSPAQVPRISVDPLEKQHFILIPQYARPADIDLLKLDVHRFRRTNPTVAEQICIRLNALAMGQDLEVMNLWAEIRNEISPPIPRTTPASSSEDSDRSAETSTATTTTVSDVRSNTFSEDVQPKRNISQQAAESTRKLPATARRKPQQPDLLDLSSERVGADYYAKLRDLLAAKDWKAADKETARCMLEVMDRQEEGWLAVEHIGQFPCRDLRNIDRLWVHYSQGRFGFSVQKDIWQSCGIPTEHNSDWERFGKTVGWRTGEGSFEQAESWLFYSQLTFDLAAPRGHLPVVGVGVRGRVVGGVFVRLGVGLSVLFSRVEICKGFVKFRL